MASLKRTPGSHHSPTRYVLSVYGKDTAYTDSRLSLGEVLGIEILLSGSNPGGQNSGLHDSLAGTGRLAMNLSSRTFSSDSRSFPDGVAANSRPQAGLSNAKGRKPIVWPHSLGRKIDRARQRFHFISFDKICRALSQSGGPGKSSETNYIEQVTGDTPSQGILHSRGPTIQGLSSLIEEAQKQSLEAMDFLQPIEQIRYLKRLPHTAHFRTNQELSRPQSA